MSIGVLSDASLHASVPRFMASQAPVPRLTSGAPQAGTVAFLFSVSVFHTSTFPEAYTFSA